MEAELPEVPKVEVRQIFTRKAILLSELGDCLQCAAQVAGKYELCVLPSLDGFAQEG